MKLVTIEQMNNIEQQAINNYNIPSIILMEHAGKALADKILELKKKRVLILVGKGNNGGDGLVAARHLLNAGLSLDIFLDSNDLPESASKNLSILTMLINRIFSLKDFKEFKKKLSEADLVLDTLLGTGLKGEVTGLYAKTINLVNSSSKVVISADVPSGLNADTGYVHGCCIKADYTLTFGLSKIGLHMDKSKEYVGKLEVVDISLPKALIDTIENPIHLITEDLAKSLLPNRPINSHKYNYGHVFAIGGSRTLFGAIALTAKAALKSGAGLVSLIYPESVLANKTIDLEIMTHGLSDGNSGSFTKQSLKEIKNLLKNASTLAMGPGMGRSSETREFVKSVLKENNNPIVIDADGLNLISEILDKDPDLLKNLSYPVVLTPHIGEMARLTDLSAETINKNKVAIAIKYAVMWNTILVLKGACTVVASPMGTVYLNNTGNSGMATAGSGDVLTGIIAGLIAQNLSPLDAAILGVYLHGYAGDLARDDLSVYYMSASDIIDFLAVAYKKLSKVYK